MDDDPRPTPPPSFAGSPGPLLGLRRLTVASWVGLLAQIVIWASVLALWILGSIYANIPKFTFIAYGAYGITVPAGTLFLLNILLILGSAAGLVSLLLSGRGLQAIARAPRRIDLNAEVGLATIGAVGYGMFAAGWTVWLGSFAPPGSSVNSDTTAFAPVLAPNLAALVSLLLFAGGVLAFLGMLGVAMAGSKVGTTYDDAAVEVGGVLSALPVLAIIGYALALVGLHRSDQKIERGWLPPPPPPPPTYLYPTNPLSFPGGAPAVYPGRPGSWDTVAAVLVICLVLVWGFLLPFSLLLTLSSQTYGPGNTPIGGPPTSSAASSAGGPSLFAAVLLVAVVSTALILPIAVVRNRRKRQRLMARAVAPTSPPPPAPVPPPSKDDPLDHLV